jgi:hypothetical protein
VLYRFKISCESLPVAAKFCDEKAGSCQVGFAVAFVCRVVFPGTHPPLPPSFHPQSLLSDSSLGASRAFSFQSVLLPVNRPWSMPMVSSCCLKICFRLIVTVLFFFRSWSSLRLERVDPWERTASRPRPAFSSHL